MNLEYNKTADKKIHDEYVDKLREIGKRLGFEVMSGRGLGERYDIANADCIWGYNGKGKEELLKISQVDGCDYLPFIAFEVASSEKEKNLRGSLVSLQIANASVGIFVLVGDSVQFRGYVEKLVERYSFGRFRIWIEDDVDDLYNTVKEKYPER